ncbi:hypothetical protein ABZT03_38415 [Streptomyces sp. NPDC005574]|uniref:hypothetical protein n=1 Tax=Streptomyces sp. NPDC005574 TaxID=3156891 RepID=UPI0033BBE5CA
MQDVDASLDAAELASQSVQVLRRTCGGLRFVPRRVEAGQHLFAQSPDMGALPQLYAATVPGLSAGAHIGPGGRGGRSGFPGPRNCRPQRRIRTSAAASGGRSEELTGLSWRDVTN